MEIMAKKALKQTELGLIPKDWKVDILNSIIDKKRTIRYGIVQPGKFDPNGKFLIRGQDYSFGWVSSDDFFRVSPQIEEPYKNARVKTGDVIITIVGANTGHVEVIPKWLDGSNLTQTTARLAIDPSKGNNLFYKYYLESKSGQEQVANFIKGAAQPGLNCGDIEKFKIPLPPTLAEQKAIATALSDVDELIDSLERLIFKKKAIKQGAMQELLAVGENWNTKTIKEVAIYRRGSFPQPYGLAKWYDDISGIPFVQVVDVDKNKKLKSETKQKISSEGAKMSVFVKKGSVILTIQGSIGRICITQYDAYVDRTLLIFESFKEDFNTYFFMISIWLIFQVEKEKAPGGIIKTITKEALSSFEVSYPNREEQDRIAEILEDIENEIEQIEAKKAKYQSIKQGMMQELLTGKTRLV